MTAGDDNFIATRCHI